MKVSTSFAVLIGLLVNLAIQTETAESYRVHSTLTPGEASQIIGGISERDCGFVAICNSNIDYCKDSNENRCNDKVFEIMYPGVWKDCIVEDTTKTICYSTATDRCMVEYLCKWNSGINKCLFTETIETIHEAPEFCEAL